MEVQNSSMLGTVADYFELLQDFLNRPNINISTNVRAGNCSQLFMILKFNALLIQAVNNATQVINSLLQWQPSNINDSASVTNSARLAHRQ